MDRTIKAEALKSLLSRGDVMLLDVRRAGDYAADTHGIPGARWRDPEKLGEWGTGIPKDREVVLYCVRGGAVSNAVVDALQQQGVKARFIEGGIEAWKQAGGETAQK